MKILVTGADGLLGSNLVRELLNRNYQVRAFVHPGRKTGTLHYLRLQRIKGDLLNLDDLDRAFHDIDAVIHTAASVKLWPANSKTNIDINVKGTANVIQMALHHKISRMIHVGTATSFGFGTLQNPGTEENPYSGFHYRLGYLDSKFEAHQLVLDAVKQGLPAIIVNPTFLIGPYDSAPSSGAMIMAIYKGSLPGHAPGGKNFISVKDAATAIANALTMGRVGESYILGNRNMTYHEAFLVIASIVGAKAPALKLPRIAVLAYGLLGSAYGAITGKAPTVSYPVARISCDGHYYSAQKAIKELQLPQTPIENAVKEAFDWLIKNKIKQS